MSSRSHSRESGVERHDGCDVVGLGPAPRYTLRLSSTRVIKFLRFFVDYSMHPSTWNTYRRLVIAAGDIQLVHVPIPNLRSCCSSTMYIRNSVLVGMQNLHREQSSSTILRLSIANLYWNWRTCGNLVWIAQKVWLTWKLLLNVYSVGHKWDLFYSKIELETLSVSVVEKSWKCVKLFRRYLLLVYSWVNEKSVPPNELLVRHRINFVHLACEWKKYEKFASFHLDVPFTIPKAAFKTISHNNQKSFFVVVGKTIDDVPRIQNPPTIFLIHGKSGEK